MEKPFQTQSADDQPPKAPPTAAVTAPAAPSPRAPSPRAAPSQAVPSPHVVPVPEMKPFGRWHDIAVAVISFLLNFLLGTVVAGTVAWMIHDREKQNDAKTTAAQNAENRKEQERMNLERAARSKEEQMAEKDRQERNEALQKQFREEERQEIAKERRELRLKETAAFLSATADRINQPLSRLAGYFRQGSLPRAGWFEELQQQVGLLFTKRLNAKVMSDAYMKGNTFWKDYDFITRQVSNLNDAMKKSALEGTPPDKIEEEALKNIEEVEKRFQAREYAQPDYASENLPRPREELMRWGTLVWGFTSESLALHLKMALEEPPQADGK